MTNENSAQLIPIRQFIASKQISLFQTLKQPQLTGQLILTDSKEVEYNFFLYMGRLMYATGGVHPVRRWLRNLLINAPKTSLELDNLKNSTYIFQPQYVQVSWDYDLLCQWVEQNKLSREQFTRITKGIFAELFFDLTQVGQITYQFKPLKNLPNPIVLFDADTVIVEAWKSWQAWQGAKLADRSPNLAPIIRYPEQLKAKTSSKTYQILIKLLNKQQSLRDLATQTKPDLVQLTRLLMPYVQLGLIELTDIGDLPQPVDLPKSYQRQSSGERDNPLIVALDDSPLILQTLETIVTDAGYNFISLDDADKTMAQLILLKPDFIFLDLGLPQGNSYEICAQLRKLSYFRNIPIVMLSDNGSLIDRMRARMVGATDFLFKPIDDQQMLTMLKKYLSQPSLT